MKRYEKYKPSGIDWIGEVPEHWEVTRCRFISRLLHGMSYTPKDVVSEGEGTLVLRASNIQDSKLAFDDNVFIPSEMIPAQKMTRKGDIVICSTNGSLALCGKSALVKEDGLNLSFGSFMMVMRTDQNPIFIQYQLSQMVDLYRGLFATTTINQLTMDMLKDFSFILPPLAEQEAIAAYLDARCADIDKVVATQQKRIALLQELKQSEITQAVTRGLNPDARMKDSGVDWIGMVPEHWEVKKLKFVSNSISKGAGITKEQVVEDGDTQCVRYGEIYTKYNHSFDSCVSATNKDLHPVLQYFGYGDILFTCTGELVEEIGKSVVYLGHERCLAGGDILVVSHNQDPSFLNYALNSYAQIQKSEGRAKLKVVHISTYDISNLLLALPPIEEQKQIADEIDRRCSSIDKQIGAVTRQIELLREYKQSLITDVVTGKVKVC